MRSKIIKNGIVCGYITGTISCTMERDRHTKLKRIFGSVEEITIHSKFHKIYENIGEPDSIFDMEIYNNGKPFTLENLMLVYPSMLFCNNDIVIIKNCDFTSGWERS